MSTGSQLASSYYFLNNLSSFVATRHWFNERFALSTIENRGTTALLNTNQCASPALNKRQASRQTEVRWMLIADIVAFC
jgi:hypothetical protein